MTIPLLRSCSRLLLTLLFLIAVRGESWAGPAPRYVLEGQELPVALLQTKAATFLVTTHSVLRLEGKQFVRKYRSEGAIRCALAADTALWLGTRQGAVRLDTRRFRGLPVALPDGAGAAEVVSLCRDARGGIWIGAVGYGVFRLASGGVEKVLSAPTINAALVTADSSVWIGSNLGLNRFYHESWTRYNEEGVANLEIPDNFVEKLLPDNQGNLWVLMSAGISVFPGGGPTSSTTELPTATFIGKPGNEVFSVVYVPGVGRVFATAMGLLLLPDAPAGQFASFEPSSTDKIEQKRVLVPFSLPGTTSGRTPHIMQLDQKQRVWLVSPGEVRVLRMKEFRQLAQAGKVG